jgi:hypothetical protein
MMAGMTELRLRLWSDPDLLAGFDPEAALDRARVRLRERRGDVELTHVERISADSIGVIVLVAPSVDYAGLDEIAAALRDLLGIGAGRFELVPEMIETVRGFGGRGRTCPVCGGPDGTHLPGCPGPSRILGFGGKGGKCLVCGAPDGAHLPGCENNGRR